MDCNRRVSDCKLVEPMNYTIRNETESDIREIAAITRAAFEHHPYSKQTEAAIIRELRAAGALSLSLVAELDRQIIGHVAFSRVNISDGSADWYGVGPISVRPDFQRKGIGTALMKEGIARLKTLGASGCILVGDPHFYTRLGFKNDPALFHEGVPPENLLALPFGKKAARGIVHFHDSFLTQEQD